jgi:hypothetical protein
MNYNTKNQRTILEALNYIRNEFRLGRVHEEFGIRSGLLRDKIAKHLDTIGEI